MLNATTILGIVSIVVAFFLFGATFYTVMKKKPWQLSVALGVAAFLFMTVIPVTLAVFFAVPGGAH